MQTSREVDQIMKRTQAVWYADGLVDVTLGAYFSAVGFFLLAESLTPPGSPLWLVWGMGGPLLLILGGVAAGWALKRLKARLVFPRAGYVSFERSPRGWPVWVRLALVAAVSAVVAAGVAMVSGKLNNVTLVSGLVVFAAFIYLWQRLGLSRYLVLAVWSAAVGVGLTAAGLSLEQGGAAFWLLTAGALMVAGIVAWRRFDGEVREDASEGNDARNA